MNLYHISDGAGSWYVVAESMSAAVARWKSWMEAGYEPDQISLLATGADELLLPERWRITETTTETMVVEDTFCT